MTEYIIKETTTYGLSEISRTFIANVNDTLVVAKRKAKKLVDQYMDLKHRSTGIKFRTTGWWFYNPAILKDKDLGINLGQIKYEYWEKGVLTIKSFELFAKKGE